MNLKKITGILTANMFIVSCGIPNLIQENNAVEKQNVVNLSVIDMSKENGIKSGSSMKLKIGYPAFKTKSANGHTKEDLAYILVNLCKNPTDPLAADSLLSNIWQRVNKVDFIPGGSGDEFEIVIKNVTGGIVSPGATWHGAMRAFDTDDNEINIINPSLTGSSQGQRIAISENVVHVKQSDNKFYTDETFITPEPNPLIDINLTIEIGATITSGLDVNNGSFALPGIQVIKEPQQNGVLGSPGDIHD